jgi:bifunctional UDP-N-acetylglucosamine pyrophosphorylase / glucosamine-1-phosphate N-acetyltransferase
MPESLIVVVMAAGKSTRFKSNRSKLVHAINGKTIIERVIEAAEALSPKKIYVVLGHGRDEIQSALNGHNISFIIQEPQLGTGHCAQVATRALKENSGTVLLMNGDIPLITPQLLNSLLQTHRSRRAALTLVSTLLEDPTGYGRLIKSRTGTVSRIVEERDATPGQRRIREINAGLFVLSVDILQEYIFKLDNQNDQKEYYLTDLIGMLSRARKKVLAFQASDAITVLGVNDRVEMAHVDSILRMRNLHQLMREGVTILEPSSTTVEEDVRIGADTILYPGVRIEGKSSIGSCCIIRSHCRIADSTLDDDVTVNDLSVIHESHVASHASIGPFAHLRQGSEVESHARVGNFVELKKTRLGKGSKASHLTYLGDTVVGKNANIGAGTITCNYDGVNKNTTIIEDECFIGSGVELVAPVAVRKGAYVAAGSVITEEVPADALAIGRSRQENKLEWKKRRKQKKT